MNQEISVVIPYYNEAETILTTLTLLSCQSVRPQEVILVDSGSTDGTYEIIQGWIEKNRDQLADVRYINLRALTKVPSSSRNEGVRVSKSGLIAFMDCGLLFSTDWLEKQVDFMNSGNFGVVSGGCYLEGANLWDRAASAQTYGYRRFRPCIPSSLMKKSVFDRAGPFLEGRRAGYDVDWANRLKTVGVLRGINRGVVLRYNGINYAGSLKNLFVKSVEYAQGTVGVHGYYYPYAYLLLTALFLLALFLEPTGALLFLALYVVCRGYCVPFLKSRGFRIALEHPLSLLTLPLAGFIIDLGKIIGALKGLVRTHSTERRIS